MKEEVFDLEGLEALLMQKSYGELSENERQLVSLHVASESEYNDLRDTLKNVKKTFHDEKVMLRPQVDMKESLLKKFEEIHGKGKDTLPMDTASRKFHIPVFYRYAGVAAVLVLGLFLVLNQYTGKNKTDNPLAMEKEKTMPEKQTGPVTTEHTVLPPVEENVTDGKELPPVTTTATTQQQENEVVSSPGSTVASGQTNDLSMNDEIVTKEANNGFVVSEMNKTTTGTTTGRSEGLGGVEQKSGEGMVSHNDHFYTQPNESSNMSYDYRPVVTEDQKERRTNLDLAKNRLKKDSDGDYNKREDIPYQTQGYYYNPHNKGKDKDITRASQKETIRKSLVYSDL